MDAMNGTAPWGSRDGGVVITMIPHAFSLGGVQLNRKEKIFTTTRKPTDHVKVHKG
jgi:hypothetical protein